MSTKQNWATINEDEEEEIELAKQLSIQALQEETYQPVKSQKSKKSVKQPVDQKPVAVVPQNGVKKTKVISVGNICIKTNTLQQKFVTVPSDVWIAGSYLNFSDTSSAKKSKAQFYDIVVNNNNIVSILINGTIEYGSVTIFEKKGFGHCFQLNATTPALNFPKSAPVVPKQLDQLVPKQLNQPVPKQLDQPVPKQLNQTQNLYKEVSKEFSYKSVAKTNIPEPVVDDKPIVTEPQSIKVPQEKHYIQVKGVLIDNVEVLVDVPHGYCWIANIGKISFLNFQQDDEGQKFEDRLRAFLFPDNNNFMYFVDSVTCVDFNGTHHYFGKINFHLNKNEGHRYCIPLYPNKNVIDIVDDVIDNVDELFDDVEKLFDDAEKQFEGVEEQFDDIEEQFDDIENFDKVVDNVVDDAVENAVETKQICEVVENVKKVDVETKEICEVVENVKKVVDEIKSDVISTHIQMDDDNIEGSMTMETIATMVNSLIKRGYCKIVVVVDYENHGQLTYTSTRRFDPTKYTILGVINKIRIHLSM